jgi:hypothetical protein
MMGGLLHGAPGGEFLLGGQVLGPPEAFYPFRSVGPDGRLLDHDDDNHGDDDDDDDDEQMLNVNDFIDFGDGSSSGDNDDRDDDLATIESSTSDAGMTSPTIWNPPSAPETVASSPTVTSAQSLLDHFDRGVVTSFRRNQHRHKMLLKSPVRGQMSMAAPTVSGSAIKGGRFAAANSPITPKRKRKLSVGSMPPPSSFGLSGTAANGHKRRKSDFV